MEYFYIVAIELHDFVSMCMYCIGHRVAFPFFLALVVVQGKYMYVFRISYATFWMTSVTM